MRWRTITSRDLTPREANHELVRRSAFGTKRTSSMDAVMSASDPKRTFKRLLTLLRVQ
jgi:hypothetical protein